MIGIDRIVESNSLVPGRIYRFPLCSNALIMALQPSERALSPFLTLDAPTGKSLAYDTELSVRTSLVELPPVKVWVDPTSAKGTPQDFLPRGADMVVRGNEPILFASSNNYGWQPINLETGALVDRDLGTNWVCFRRWSLVSTDSFGCDTVHFAFEGA